MELRDGGLWGNKGIYFRLEVRGPSGPQLLVGGPSGRLDFVLRALRALRPRLTHQMRLTHQAAEILSPTDEPTNEQGDSRSGIIINCTKIGGYDIKTAEK